MSRLTSSSMRLYREFAGEYDAGAGPESPKAAGPTFVKIEDPMVPVDQVVELLDEGTKYGRIANAWLRRKGNRRLARDAETGAMALEGRVCCMELARRVDRELARITPPKDFRCDVCGALWRVEVRVREDRRARVW